MSSPSSGKDKEGSGQDGQPKFERRVMRRPHSIERTFSPRYEQTRRDLASALDLAVQHSERPSGGSLHTSSLGTKPLKETSWITDLFRDDFHKFFNDEEMGNYIIVRKTGAKQWEYMPIYARIGMHLLFHGPSAIRFVTWGGIRRLLKDQSIRQGRIYDNTDPKIVLPQIRSFIATYAIETSELLEKDLTKYPTFNSFFSRKLKPNARQPASPNDLTIISSSADSRLTVFRTVDAARKFWIKGRQFTIPALVHEPWLAKSLGTQQSLAIFRLAPQDYHRFHSPVTGTVRKITHIPGEYYTVNPQAINENLDVFTANTRSVAVLDAKFSKDTDATIPVVVVAVGALLVGSINWEKHAGEHVNRGEDLGYFAYGGSTIIVVFPESCHLRFDEDLIKASEASVEVLVRAAEKIAVAGEV